MQALLLSLLLAGAGPIIVPGNVTSTPTAPLTGDICIGDAATGVVCYDERGAQGQTVTTDVAPATVIVNGTDAAAAAATNKTGGNLELSGGLPTLTIAIDSYAVCSTDTVTVTVNGTANVLTEGTNWTAATSNAVTCGNLATAVAALSGVGATCSSSTVLITGDTTTHTVTLAESDAACTTVSANTAGVVKTYGTKLLVGAEGPTSPMIQVGGTTSSYPALKRTGTGLELRLADDSAYSVLSAKQFALYDGAVVDLHIDPNGASPHIAMTNAWNLKWYADAFVTLDLTVYRAAAGVLAIGTAASSGNGEIRARIENRLTATPTEPVACAAGTFGQLTVVNDTNDGAVSYLCYCGQGADDTTYDWLKVSDNTACASF
jgi:hypothetical protein